MKIKLTKFQCDWHRVQHYIHHLAHTVEALVCVAVCYGEHMFEVASNGTLLGVLVTVIIVDFLAEA